MKNFNTVALVILLFVVGYLFVKDLNTGKTSSGELSEAELVENLGEMEFNGVRIAYVDTDSLVSQYNYHKKLKLELEKKAKALEADLAQKSAAFDENYAVLQQQAANLNPQQLQAAQAELQGKQQELLLYRDQKARELAEQENELNTLIKEDMESVLESVKQEFQLDYVLSYDPNSILLSANEDYNITDVVAKRLNAKYKEAEKLAED